MIELFQKKNKDGTYTLTGNKIFITAEEHDLAENIIHLVFARIEGAPEGTRGISLFSVPKFWVNDGGPLGEKNQERKVMFHMMNEARLGVGIQAMDLGARITSMEKGLVFL